MGDEPPVDDWSESIGEDDDEPGEAAASVMEETADDPGQEDNPSSRHVYFGLPRDFFANPDHMTLCAINTHNKQAVSAATILMFLFDCMDLSVTGNEKKDKVQCTKKNQFNHQREKTTFITADGRKLFRISTQFEAIFSATGIHLGFRVHVAAHDESKDLNEMVLQRVIQIGASKRNPLVPDYLKMWSRSLFYDHVADYHGIRVTDVVDRPMLESFTFDAATAMFSGICEAQANILNYANGAFPFKLGVVELPSSETTRKFEHKIFPRKIGCQALVMLMRRPNYTTPLEQAFAEYDASASMNPELKLICDMEGMRAMGETMQSLDFLDAQFATNRDVLTRLKGVLRQTEMKVMMRKFLRSVRNEGMVRSKGSETYAKAIRHLRAEEKTFRININDPAHNLTPHGNAVLSLVSLISGFMHMRDGELLRNFIISLFAAYSAASPSPANMTLHVFMMDQAAAGKTYIHDILKKLLLYVDERSSTTLASITVTSNSNFDMWDRDEANPGYFGLGDKGNTPTPATRAMTDFFKQIMTAGVYIATHGEREGKRNAVFSLILATVSVQAALNTKVSYNDLNSNPSLTRVIPLSIGSYYKSTRTIAQMNNSQAACDEAEKLEFVKDMHTIHAMYVLISMLMKAGIMDYVEEGMTYYVLEKVEQQMTADNIDLFQERQKTQIKNMARVICQLSAIVVVLGGGAFRDRDWSFERKSVEEKDAILVEILIEIQKLLVVNQQHLIFSLSLLETHVLPVRENKFIADLKIYLNQYAHQKYIEMIPGQPGSFRSVEPLILYEVEYSVLVQDLVRNAKLPEHVVRPILQKLMSMAVTTERILRTTRLGGSDIDPSIQEQNKTRVEARTKILEIVTRQDKQMICANQTFLDKPFGISMVDPKWIAATIKSVLSTCKAHPTTYATFMMLFFPNSTDPVPYGFDCITILPDPAKVAMIYRPAVLGRMHEICLDRKPRNTSVVQVYNGELEEEFMRKHNKDTGVEEEPLTTRVLSARARVQNMKRALVFDDYLQDYVADAKRRRRSEKKMELLTPAFIETHLEALISAGVIHMPGEEFAENRDNFDEMFDDLLIQHEEAKALAAAQEAERLAIQPAARPLIAAPAQNGAEEIPEDVVNAFFQDAVEIE